MERFQLLTILAICVKHPQLAGFLLTQNRSSFSYVEGSSAWLYDCPYHLTPLYIVEQCYDKIAVNCLETVMYIDPITRKTFGYANQTLTLINILFLLQNRLKKTISNFLNLPNFRLLLAQTYLLHKMGAFILKKNSNNFRIVVFLLDILIIHSIFC